MGKESRFDMSFCETCSLEEKLMQCCGTYPQTGETSVLSIRDNEEVEACPHLNSRGKCGIYNIRPQGCREHFCDAFMTSIKQIGKG